jgi:hypothetical protein
MNPKDFKDWYGNLSVNAAHPNGKQYVFKVAVTKYRMNSPSNQTDGQKAIDAIRWAAKAKNQSFRTSAADSSRLAIPIDDAAFNYAKFFRGTPAQLEHILNTAIQSGYFKDPTQANVQNWVTSSFATDCVGFVSSYFRSERGAGYFTWDNVANHGCGPFFDKAKATDMFVWYPSELREQDVILWMREDRSETRTPVGHISMIHSVVAPPSDGGQYELKCVESNGATGNDPRETTRHIKATSKNDGDGNPAYWQGPDGKCYIEMTDGSKVIFARMP